MKNGSPYCGEPSLLLCVLLLEEVSDLCEKNLFLAWFNRLCSLLFLLLLFADSHSRVYSLDETKQNEGNYQEIKD